MTTKEVTDFENSLLRSIDTDEIVSLASALIDAGGENPGGTEGGVAHVLASRCRDLGFRVEMVEVAPGRPNVIVSIGESGESGKSGD